MRRLLKSQASSVIIFLFVAVCVIFIKCIDRSNEERGSQTFNEYAGSQSCAPCHRSIYDSFITTGHFLTSQIATEKNVIGTFKNGRNIFHYNPALLVAMEKTDSGLYQVEYENGVKTIARRFDIIIGSGTRGQTYLSWQNNELTQLPVSYLTSANEWANSPGYSNQVFFTRTINSKCLQCHTTYADTIPGELANTPQEFYHDRILYGITCEKCHGPGARHVEFQTENPSATSAKYIINPHAFSRQQTLDLCAQCHGGPMKNIKPAFTFMPGDKLNDYFAINASLKNSSIDVHGNQMGLLAKSKCFRMSSMTCLTCHSPHDDQQGQIALFSQKCIACHNKEHGNFCTIKTDKIENINSNCIDCHMPRQISKSIVLEVQDHHTPTAQLLRTHFITVYPDATKKFLSK